MKKLLYVLLFACLSTTFLCCSNDDHELDDYTSIVIVNNTGSNVEKCTIGYKKDNIWIKLSEFGYIENNRSSRIINIYNYNYENIYVFIGDQAPIRTDKFWILEKSKSNSIKLDNSLKYINVIDKNDNKEYPM